jgi:phosphoenolpyruvate phosphomutase
MMAMPPLERCPAKSFGARHRRDRRGEGLSGTVNQNHSMESRVSQGNILRGRMQQNGLVHLMAAHSPLSAILVQEAGFDGVWASGFELAALYGVPDTGILTMTQHLEMVRAMAARIELPIIADIDTGFGNAINAFHAIGEYERAGAAGIVMEDKTFPKLTSLAPGNHDLVSIPEFQGKLEAAQEARRDPDFVVIGRTEALIAGLGQEEALRRARAYDEAGADLVMVHSKANSPAEMESFLAQWTGKAPIVVVPTTFPAMTEARMRELGKVGMVIYGNFAIRASVTAMRAVFRQIRDEGGIQNVGTSVASVAEILELQGMARHHHQSDRFLR